MLLWEIGLADNTPGAPDWVSVVLKLNYFVHGNQDTARDTYLQASTELGKPSNLQRINFSLLLKKPFYFLWQKIFISNSVSL